MSALLIPSAGLVQDDTANLLIPGAGIVLAQATGTTPTYPVYLGSTEVTGIYLGSTVATGLYLGATQLWP